VAVRDTRATSADEAVQDPRRSALARLVFDFRVVSLTVTFVSLIGAEGSKAPLVVGLLVAVIMSVVPLLMWERVGPLIARHPIFMAFDLLITMSILGVIGADSPFFFYTLGTALLSGVVYGWVGAAIASPFLVIAYLSGLSAQDLINYDFQWFQIIAGDPALYPLAAAAGAAVSRLLDRQIRTETLLRETSWSNAIERERSRIAREMHDSLAKTLYGIALQASALRRWVTKDPARAQEEAAVLAAAAEVAAREGRQLIFDLRADDLDAGLTEAFTNYVQRWSERSGVGCEYEVDIEDAVAPSVRWELFQILKEALDNVEQHAGAGSVRLRLSSSGNDLELVIHDDGKGCDRSNVRSKGDGHYGIVGMSERAERIGGSFTFESASGAGTKIIVRAPLETSDQRNVSLGEVSWQTTSSGS
jgi:signal transduction histidine kinase